ncbi:MAG: ABC transporter ATP-binding protein, partial [Lachnospiraceae bacterium]|nr:ABC transporter ATP-binding protein [Lachnospiraceae bacterium]
MALLDLVNPRIIACTVDAVIGEEEANIPPFLTGLIGGIGGEDFLKTHLYVIALVILGVALLSVISRYFFRLFNAKGGEKLVCNMRDTLYDHIIHLPVKWHNENQTGDIIQRCTSDVDTVRRFLSDQMTNLVRVIILIVLSIAFMLNINVKLAMIAISLVPVIIGYSLIFHRKIGASFQKVDDMEG